MKLLIATDMEGISGVVFGEHVDPAHPEYQRFRRLMTEDINAVIAGAAAGGADEFLVTDGHWNSTNILIEALDPRAVLNCGTPSPLSMVDGIDQGVDAALFIGYHARAGTAYAVHDHTWSGVRVLDVRLNDRLVGEFGLNAAVCSQFNVPVIMVSGDQAACAEGREWVPGVETAQVKTALGRYSAACLPLEQARAILRETAERAVRKLAAGQAPAPLAVAHPIRMQVAFHYTIMADSAALLPGATRLDGRTIAYESADMVSAYRSFRAAVSLAKV
jgi:D-amino peptidase